VLGATYVDKAMAGVDEFSQNSSSCSAPTAGTTSGTGPACRARRARAEPRHAVRARQGHELKLHIRGSLNNGLTKDEIKEVFLQVAIYCGVPAAVVAFRCAKEVFADVK
jgi:4-carboxymuconolactone decarboxylase